MLCASARNSPGLIRELAIAGDAAALLGAFAGGLAAFACWYRLRNTGLARRTDTIARSRKLLLAMGAMMTSVWLFGAILFNAIGSVPVQACAG